MESDTIRLIEMAGTQRLPADIRRGELRDESSILRVLEAAVYSYTKGIPAKDLHDKKKTSIIYKEISTIFDQFDCVAKGVFQQAWKILLCADPFDPKNLLETIASIICNRTIQHYITSQLRTPSKYKETLKRVLHMGGSFESLFEEVGLTTTELAQKAHRVASDAKLCAILDSVISAETFTKDFDVIVQQFYKLIRGVQSDLHRTEYYNKFLVKLVQTLTSSAPSVLTIFVQVYCFFMTSESIKTIDPRITAYLMKHPVDFFLHQVRYLPLKLHPNSNFKQEGFQLDAWQEECLQAIDKGRNLLMSARTSAGKTILSTHAIRNYSNVWYIVPSDPLGYQLTGIILASLLELELRKGSIKKNVRLELSTTSYKRFSQTDKIIVATPEQMVRLIQSKSVTFPEYIILDEFHNIHGKQGLFYEYLLKFAGFHAVPLMVLSATIPNFEEVRNWLTRILPGPLFAVNLQKRFFNQKRMTFCGGKLVPINPLNHMTIEQVRRSSFQQIGLYPQEILSLYEALPSVSRVDGLTPRLVSLDEMERLELDLFAHLKKQEDAVLEKRIHNIPVASDNLTLYQLYNFLRSVTIKPMIIFKMESVASLTLFANMVKMIQAYNKLVYGGFNGDKHIIKEYLEEVDHMEKSVKLSISKEETADDIEDKKDALKELLFTSKYKPRLYAMYDKFLEDTPKEYTEFNELYNGDLSYEAVLKIRQMHIRNEKKYDFDTIRVRNTYTIHRDAMIARMDGSDMRDIRNKINNELRYQLHQSPNWKDMGEEFSDFNKIEETRRFMRYLPKEKRWEESPSETRPIVNKGVPWRTEPYSYEDLETLRHEEIIATSCTGYKHTYKIDYEHPVLVGIECGLLFYNDLMNPALTRICQQLISKHPLIILSDHSLAVGINYPIKTVLLLGGLKDEPVEEIENTLAHQAAGRAGRRGLDAEGIVIYSGVNITKILTPDYYPVCRNPVEAMLPLLSAEEEPFKTFVLTEVRPPAPAPAVATPAPAIAAPAPAPAVAAGAAGAAGAIAAGAASSATEETKESWEDYF